MSVEELREEILKTILNEVVPVLKRTAQAQPRFNGKRVPTTYAADALGMAPRTLKAQMRLGNLGIGSVSIDEETGQHNYYISPKLLYERTGYIYPPSLEGGEESVTEITI